MCTYKLGALKAPHIAVFYLQQLCVRLDHLGCTRCIMDSAAVIVAVRVIGGKVMHCPGCVLTDPAVCAETILQWQTNHPAPHGVTGCCLQQTGAGGNCKPASPHCSQILPPTAQPTSA